MRLNELVLRIPGDELRLHFHEQLTVLCGLGMVERGALIERILTALAGTADGTTLTVHEGAGREIEIVSESGLAVARYTDDGTLAPLVLGSVAQTMDELQSLMLLTANDLGLTTVDARADDEPELVEARATLVELTKELHDAMADWSRLQGHRDELAAVESAMQRMKDDVGRRAYAKTLYDLERAKAELAATAGGPNDAETDRHLLTASDPVRSLARQWERATAEVNALTAKFGAVPRIAADVLPRVCRFPATVPADLDVMQAELDDARLRRDRLEAQLRELAGESLAQPSDPRVVNLASADQTALWSARDRFLVADAAVQREQLAVGGPGGDAADDGIAASITARIEDAQRAVDAAEAERQRWFVPSVTGSAIAALLCLMSEGTSLLLAAVFIAVCGAVAVAGIGLPTRRKSLAEGVVRRALADAGADSYLGFHLRRVDVAIDRKASVRLNAALLDRREATAQWEEIAPGIDMATANALEQEVRAYAAQLAELGDAANDIEAVRTALTRDAEPALARARARLADACRQFGIEEDALDSTDAALVDRLVQTQVLLGARGRIQVSLEAAEAAQRELAGELEGLLASVGFTDGPLDARLGALDWAIDRAMEREQARIDARPREEIEADVAKLEAEANALRRPEWAEVEASSDDGPNEYQLITRAAELREEIEADEARVIDLDDLNDRHSALERRVASLEAAAREVDSDAVIGELADVHQFLLAHLTKAGHAGPFDESMPVLVDDAFLRVAAERKWELLDMLRRLGEKTQLVYMTDDPFVSAWARRRAAAGLVTLLEPAGSDA